MAGGDIVAAVEFVVDGAVLILAGTFGEERADVAHGLRDAAGLFAGDIAIRLALRGLDFFQALLVIVWP